MAFEKNPLKDGTKTKLKDYSVDLENRIGNIGKADIGLGNVLNERQVAVYRRDVLNSTSTIILPDESAMYVLVTSWGDTSSTSMYVINTRGGGINIGEIKADSQVTVTASGLTLTVSRSTYRFVSLVRIW